MRRVGDAEDVYDRCTIWRGRSGSSISAPALYEAPGGDPVVLVSVSRIQIAALILEHRQTAKVIDQKLTVFFHVTTNPLCNSLVQQKLENEPNDSFQIFRCWLDSIRPKSRSLIDSVRSR